MASNNLTCALSGQCPTPDPVVTPTGQICSKKLLLQKLTETNYMNPFTTSSSSPMPLDESQLIEIQGGGAETNVVPPKASTSNSIPSILNTLSSEYDALVLELYDTRKALEETRKELSVALYQNDAAIRVIARVVLERDLARRQLAENLAKGGGEGVSSDGGANKRKRDGVDSEASAAKKINVVEEENDVQMEDGDGDEDGAHIPKAHSSQLQEKWSELCKTRKSKTKASSNHASLDSISKFEATAKKYHKTTNKGIASLSAPIFFSGTDDEPVIVSSGTTDKQLVWYNAAKHQIQKSDQLKKPLMNSQCLSTYDGVTAMITNDYTLYVYSDSDESAPSSLVLDNDDDDEVVGVCVHPTCEHVFVSTGSGKVHVIFVEKSSDGGKATLKNVATLKGLDDDSGAKCTSMGLHPDGLILALGRNDGKISVWDLKTEKLASTFEVSFVDLLLFFWKEYTFFLVYVS